MALFVAFCAKMCLGMQKNVAKCTFRCMEKQMWSLPLSMSMLLLRRFFLRSFFPVRVGEELIAIAYFLFPGLDGLCLARMVVFSYPVTA